MEKTWKVILAFAGVFIAGGICGGLAVRLAGRMMPPPGRPNLQAFWPQMKQRLEARLELTAAQREQLRPILRRAQQEVQTLRRVQTTGTGAAMDRMHTEIEALLTPEQRVKLQEMRKKLRERIERERGELRGGQRPPGPPPH